MTDAEAAQAWVEAFVAALAEAGLRDACICPGSRSTPLALGFARQPAVRTWVHLDERSAAYFALGLALGGCRPAAVVCTSGTAAANLAPAVAEAFHAGVPLLALTADRPPELRGWGAPQTIDQIGLFGRNVKWFSDPGVPDGGPAGLRLARALARRAASLAWSDPVGPVHVNLPFREPLLPTASVREEPQARGAEPGRPGVPVAGGSTPAPGSTPRGTGAAATGMSRGTPPAGAIERLSRALAGTERGLIVCGPHDDPALGPAVRALADALAFPVLADPLSQVRRGPHHGPAVLDSYDACLRVSRLAAGLVPEVVVRLGGPPTSKALNLYLERHAGARQWVVEPLGWRDPERLAADLLPADPRATALELAARAGPVRRVSAWLATWQEVDRRARLAMDRPAAPRDPVTEAGVFAELARLLPPGALLFAGNSMPVRDMDSFLPGGPSPLRVLANRGVNGIDGVVSTALGCTAAGGTPAALVVGDLSFYHDMNGLLMARRYGPPLVVVLVHNDGGGIFSFLPQARLGAAEFEGLFGTPHGLDFRAAAALYGLPYASPDTWEGFRSAVGAALASGGTRIVALRSDRAGNAAWHRDRWAAAEAALQGVSLAGGGA